MSDPAKLPTDVRHKLLLARAAHIAGAYAEAYHWLYAIACPGFDCYDPWAALEGRQCGCGPHRMESTHVPTVAEREAIVAPGDTNTPANRIAADQPPAVQPERCCLDYPRCDCNSPPEPDNAPTLQPCGHPWKAQHDFKCILCSSPG